VITVYLSLLHLKIRLQVLKFEFCQIELGYKTTDKFAIFDKIPLKLNSNSSILLEYGRKSPIPFFEEEFFLSSDPLL